MSIRFIVLSLLTVSLASFAARPDLNDVKLGSYDGGPAPEWLQIVGKNAQRAVGKKNVSI